MSEQYPAIVRRKTHASAFGIVDKSSPPRDTGRSRRQLGVSPPHAGAFSHLKGIAHARAPSAVSRASERSPPVLSRLQDGVRATAVLFANARRPSDVAIRERQVARDIAGRLRESGGPTYTFSEDRRAVRPHTRTCAEADYLLVFP